MYGTRGKNLDEEQQLLLDDNSLGQRDYNGGLPPTSMACSNCFQPYDLEEETPYQLLCDHSACKQCLRSCHKGKSPYICTHDSVVVPVSVIKTLSKNLEVIKVLRERQALEIQRMERIRQVSYVEPPSDTKQNEQSLKYGQQYIDIRKQLQEQKGDEQDMVDKYYRQPPSEEAKGKSMPQSPQMKPQNSPPVEIEQQTSPKKSEQLNQLRLSDPFANTSPTQLAANYFDDDLQQQQPSAFPNNNFPLHQQQVPYAPPSMKPRPSTTNPQPESQQQQQQPDANTLQVVKPALAGLLMTPLKEIQEEASGADLTSTSFNGLGKKKKKKKKKKKRNEHDVTIQGEFQYYEEAGEVVQSQRSTPKEQQLDGGLDRQRSRSAAQTPAEKAEDSGFYPVPSPLKGEAKVYGEYIENEPDQQRNVFFGGQGQENVVNLRMDRDGQQLPGLNQNQENNFRNMMSQHTRASQMGLPNFLNDATTRPQSSQVRISSSTSPPLRVSDHTLQPYVQQQQQNPPQPNQDQFNSPQHSNNPAHILDNRGNNLYSTPAQQQLNYLNIEEIKKGDEEKSLLGPQSNIMQENGFQESVVGGVTSMNRRYEESEPPTRSGTQAPARFGLNMTVTAETMTASGKEVQQYQKTLPPKPPGPFVKNFQIQQSDRSFNSNDLGSSYIHQIPGANPLQQPLPISVQLTSNQVPHAFSDACPNHPEESVKYYCRNGECMCGLCWICILEHSRHDFVSAQSAAGEVKSSVKQARHLCKQQAHYLKELKALTETKLKALNDRREKEFSNLTSHFNTLRRTLDEREIFLRASFNVEISEFETKLLKDVEEIQTQHEEYVILFGELKTMSERFNVSSELAIVSNAKRAWEISTKTNEHVNKVIQKQGDLFILQNNNGQIDLNLPELKIDIEKEKKKIEMMGSLQLKNLMMGPTFDTNDIFQNNPLFDIPQYNQIQYDELMSLQQHQQQQDLKPLTLPHLQQIQNMSEDQRREMIPYLERELQNLMTDNDRLIINSQQPNLFNTMERYPQPQFNYDMPQFSQTLQPSQYNMQIPQQQQYTQDNYPQQQQSNQQQLNQLQNQTKKSHNSVVQTLAQLGQQANSQTIRIPAQSLTNLKGDIGLQVDQDPKTNQITLKLIKEIDENPINSMKQSNNLPTQFPTILEDPDEATPVEILAEHIGSNRGGSSQIGTRRPYGSRIGLPQVASVSTESRSIQTKTKKTLDIPIQCQSDTRSVRTQTKKLKEPQPVIIIPQKDARNMHTQTHSKKAYTLETQTDINLFREEGIQVEIIKSGTSEVKEIIKEKVVYKEPQRPEQKMFGMQTVQPAPWSRPLPDQQIGNSSVDHQPIATQTSMNMVNTSIQLTRNNTAKNMKSLPPTPLNRQLSKVSADKKSDRQDIMTDKLFKIQTTPLRNIHWFRWDTNEIFRMNSETKNWEMREDIVVPQKFLCFGTVVHLPQDQGCFLLGGTDNDQNFSKRAQFFVKYNIMLEKSPMLNKRAFFSAIFAKQEIYVFGGSDSQSTDLAQCEKFSLIEGQWKSIAPLLVPRNGTACVNIDRLIFVFGGNNYKNQGSLSSIEMYEIDLNKWTTLQIQLQRPIHDMQVIQISRNRVLVCGGHTDLDGPNKVIEIVDLAKEIYKTRFQGQWLSLPEGSEGGKSYFTPVVENRKMFLIFGYCDEAPYMEEVDIHEFTQFLSGPNPYQSLDFPGSRPRSSSMVMIESPSPNIQQQQQDVAFIEESNFNSIVDKQDKNAARSKSNNPGINALLERHDSKKNMAAKSGIPKQPPK